jgi:tRNA (adenine22-N1)-methyltransferase
MRLTPRLAAIAELIPPGSTVADIGTDHAYLPLYLVQEEISQRVVASDMNSAPLHQARETVAAFNCLQKIDLRQGDGLKVIQAEDQINTVVIAGIGGETIIKILEGGRDKLKSVERLILQPMTESGTLRLYLAHNGYALVRESLALEGRRLYEIIMAKPGMEDETDLFRLSLGPRLLEVKPPLLPLLLQEKIRKLRIVQRSLQRARQENVSDKLQEVEKTLVHLEEVLSCCCPSGR